MGSDERWLHRALQSQINMVVWNVCGEILACASPGRAFEMFGCCAGEKKERKGEGEKNRKVCVCGSFGSTQKRWALNINLFPSPAGDADQNLPYAINAPLKWLEISVGTAAVDHRITVSVAPNQGVGFYLGCPKSAHISITTAMH